MLKHLRYYFKNIQFTTTYKGGREKKNISSDFVSRLSPALSSGNKLLPLSLRVMRAWTDRELRKWLRTQSQVVTVICCLT